MKNVQVKSQLLTVLPLLPKGCSCNVCRETKLSAKEVFGEKKFLQMCKDLGIFL